MKDPKDTALRLKAIERLKKIKTGIEKNYAREDLLTLVQELQLHQIELEIQNEELRRSGIENEELRSKYFELYELAPTGFFTLDAKGRILELNLTAAKILNKEKSFIIGNNFINFIEAAGQNKFINFIEDAFKLKTKQTAVFKITSHTEQYIQVDGIPTGHNNGTNEELRMTAYDITQKVAAETAMKESEEKYRLLFTGMTEGFALFETVCTENNRPFDYRFLEINPAFERLTGRMRADVVGRNVSQIFPDNKAFWLDVCGRAALTRNPAQAGIYSWLADKYFQVIAYSPTPKQCAVLLMDITEKKLAADILKRDNAAFEQLVDKRTRELIGAQLEMEKSKRLSDIGMLAATIAHELRNPLTAIGLAAYNIKQKANNPAIADNLATINHKISDSEQIINNLLIFSRIKPPQYEKVLVVSLMEECIVNTCNNSKKTVLFEKDTDAIKDISIEVDPYQIQEIFCNILNNALDAVPDETGKIHIKAEQKAENLEVSIRDNGCGIEKELLPSVFDPFFTTKVKGTGLGLAVCKQIIHFHNGNIDIQSEPGEGTTITICLPMKSRTSQCR